MIIEHQIRILPLLLVVLAGISCVPPSCIDQTFGLPGKDRDFLLRVIVFSEPVREPPERTPSPPRALGEWFERGSAIIIDTNGEMAVSALDMWPESCPRIEPEGMSRLLQSWQPVLEQRVGPHQDLRVMTDPEMDEDWRPDGPLLSLSFTGASGNSLSLLWDGRSSLPEDLEAAILTTLNAACSSSRQGKRYLLRDLPRQVAGRLDCAGG